VIGAIIFVTLTILGPFRYFVNWITPGDVLGGDGDIARFVANTSTFFNVLNVMLFLPFTHQVAKLCRFIIRDDNSEILSEGEPKHLDQNLLRTAELAVEQSIKEMLEMIKLVKKSLEISMSSFLEKNYRLQEKIEKIENAIDHLQKEITLYLVAVNERSSSRVIAQRIPSLLHTVNDIEKLGDFAEELNEILFNQILNQQETFYADFRDIIAENHQKILYMLELLLKYFEDYDADYAHKVFELEDRISQQHAELRQKLVSMIQNAECDAASGLNTIDYIDEIERLSNKIKNVTLAGSRHFIYLPVERPKTARILDQTDYE
jgi:phosphate:Na+ symporter